MKKPPTRVTLKSLAGELGLTVATVSRSLNGLGRRYRISEETIAAVKRAADLAGYRPDALGRALRMKRTQSIGLVVPDISNPFFASIASSVEAVARERGYVVLLGDSRESTEGELGAVEWMRDRKVDGILACPVGRSVDHLAACARDGLPVVTADRIVGDPPLPYVAADNETGGRLAAEHLLAHGHRRIGILRGLAGTTPDDERVRGFLRAAAARGVPAASVSMAGDAFSEVSGRRAAERLLDLHPELTAVFALANVIALGAMKLYAERAVRVPRDMSLIGFDDHPYAALIDPPMTVIDQPVVAIGRRAAELLIDRIRNGVPAAPGGERVPVRLVERGSVGLPPTARMAGGRRNVKRGTNTQRRRRSV